MAEYLGSAHRRTQVEKIMILLVESGAIYLALYVSYSHSRSIIGPAASLTPCVQTFQAVPIYGGSFSAGSFVAVEAVNAIIQQAMVSRHKRTPILVELMSNVIFVTYQGMYPTAIVVLVEMQKSLYDTDQVTCERGLESKSGIVFAPRDFSRSQGNSTTMQTAIEHSRFGGPPSTLDDSKHTSTKI